MDFSFLLYFKATIPLETFIRVILWMPILITIDSIATISNNI
jgi:hypothetical protein